MAKINSKAGLTSIRDAFKEKYGAAAADLGSYKRPSRVISTGVLALDLKLETGGWTLGDCHVIYGDPDIGKSSALGLASVASAQKAGLRVAIIAMEPQFSPEWAAKNGVDTDDVLILRPKHGEEAFAMLKDVVGSGDFDWVLFDSIGAVISESEMEADKGNRAYGQSGLISGSVKAVAPLAYRNEVGVLFINQVRDNTKAKIAGLKDMPGGWALKHVCITRVQLKGKESFKIKDGADSIVAGRQIVAVIERNKGGEGSGRKALFTYWQKANGDNAVGIDTFADVIETAVSTGVIRRGGSYFTLPKHEKPIQGMAKVTKYLKEHPDEVEGIRKLVLEKL